MVDKPKLAVHPVYTDIKYKGLKSSSCILSRQIRLKSSHIRGNSNKYYLYLNLDDCREIISHLYLDKVLLFCLKTHCRHRILGPYFSVTVIALHFSTDFFLSRRLWSKVSGELGYTL